MTRPASDRIFEDLAALPVSAVLEKVAVWLEDCDDHIATGRPGGLPTPPFKLSQAWVAVLAQARAVDGTVDDIARWVRRVADIREAAGFGSVVMLEDVAKAVAALRENHDLLAGLPDCAKAAREAL